MLITYVFEGDLIEKKGDRKFLFKSEGYINDNKYK